MNSSKEKVFQVYNSKQRKSLKNLHDQNYFYSTTQTLFHSNNNPIKLI